MELPEFQKTAVDFHALMQALHAQLDPEHCQSPPRFVELRGMPEWTLDPQLFARMDFPDAATSRVICLGHFYDHLAKYDVLGYYRDDGEIQSKAHRKELYERFIKKWPGVSTYRKVRESITRGVLLFTDLTLAHHRHEHSIGVNNSRYRTKDRRRMPDPLSYSRLRQPLYCCSTALSIHTIHPLYTTMPEMICDCASMVFAETVRPTLRPTALRNPFCAGECLGRSAILERLYRCAIWPSIVQINLLR